MAATMNTPPDTRMVELPVDLLQRIMQTHREVNLDVLAFMEANPDTCPVSPDKATAMGDVMQELLDYLQQRYPVAP